MSWGSSAKAVDGCKLPGNASNEWRGSKAELTRRREHDRQGQDDAQVDREARQITTLRAKVKKLKAWLDDHDDKPGKSGKPKQSNLTDHDSAKPVLSLSRG